MKKALDQRALQFACQKVEDFALVNVARPADGKQEALDLWFEYIGFEEDLRSQFYHWLDDFVGEDAWDAQVLLGLIVGLLVNEYNHGSA